MGFQTFFCLFLFIFSNIISLSNAYSFKAGGKDGWTVNPSESYDSWTKRQRFSVNDSITFTYPQGSNSVLIVSKDDYDKCNIDSPIMKYEDGNSVVKLDRPGPFYFISGNKQNCDKGQKLAVVVISPRSTNNPKTPVSPAASPPATTTAPPMAPSPKSSPVTPTTPPTMSPTSPENPTLPSSPSQTPAMSPGSASPPAPAMGGMAPATSPGSSGLSPSGSPSSSAPNGSPANSNSSTDKSFAAAFSPAVVLVAIIGLVTSLFLGRVR